MRTLRVFLVCVVCIAVFCCVDRAEAEFKPGGFAFGILSYYTHNELAYGGATGYVGISRNNRGLGVMGSYEVGNTTIEGFDTRLEFTNFYLSASLKAGRSTFIVSQGFSTAKGSIEEFELSRSGYATAITLIYETGSIFKFMGQARLQGQEIMLTAGVGF